MRPECRTLLLDNDALERRFVATLAETICDGVVEASTAKDAMRALAQRRKCLGLIVAALEAKTKAAIKVLRRLNALHMSIPIVLIVARGAEALVPLARELGGRFFVHQPLHADDVDHAMREALKNGKLTQTDPPPLTAEERGRNLTLLVDQLNSEIKCSAGRQQVFLHSFVEDVGRTTTPRVTLRCPLREGLGLQPYVYYEHIRDVCCAAPERCEALQAYAAEHTQSVSDYVPDEPEREEAAANEKSEK